MYITTYRHVCQCMPLSLELNFPLNAWKEGPKFPNRISKKFLIVSHRRSFFGLVGDHSFQIRPGGLGLVSE